MDYPFRAGFVQKSQAGGQPVRSNAQPVRRFFCQCGVQFSQCAGFLASAAKRWFQDAFSRPVRRFFCQRGDAACQCDDSGSQCGEKMSRGPIFFASAARRSAGAALRGKSALKR